MKKSKQGMTISEASDFFDEHDIFEFEDVVEVKDIKFDLKKKKYVGLDMSLFERLRTRQKASHKRRYADTGMVDGKGWMKSNPPRTTTPRGFTFSLAATFIMRKIHFISRSSINL